MSTSFKNLFVSTTLAAALVLSSCTTNKTATASSQDSPLKEMMPGIVEGYLLKEEAPNSLALIPPPPQEGSIAFALDQEYAKQAVASHDTARFNLAMHDADLHFPAAVKSFESTVGIEISETKTPKLYMLMRRVMTDASLSTAQAKNYYKRQRPFMINNTPTCTPQDEEGLRKNGSYPSGHTAIGWAWALVFSEIFPDKTDSILQRGYAFGESRVVCNVHWHSDVEMGRVMGAAAVARLHADPDFMKDLEAVKKEVKKVLGTK